ncbi:MAG TPA: Gfo/Idh/MocA family oxidoreductase [Chthoniobacteraceae bacterium]|jgi:predicted dehydrogenase|nr:Gfo/Idh/MocA family oxidoreductase [Chthoniobacteraceae bacterium]
MKLALLGLKGHVGAVLAGARALGDVEVVAVSEDDPKLLASFIKKEPLLEKAQSYEQWRHLIEHTMPDACCVAGENGLRFEQLLALLERDIHIVAEKPLVTTLADLERLRAAFVKSKSQLSMLLELRHQPKNARVREIVRRGDIGEVCQVATQKSYQWGERPDWYRSRARLGGTIPFIGIHSLDLIQWVTGLDFTHLAGFHGNIGHPEMGETEAHASVLAQLANGASVTARLDYLRPAAAATHGDDRLRVVGTKGIVEVNEGDDTVSLIAGDKTERIPFGETENLFVEFVKALRGGPAPRIAADDCFYITEVVLQARQAADDKKLIALAPRRAVRAAGR